MSLATFDAPTMVPVASLIGETVSEIAIRRPSLACRTVSKWSIFSPRRHVLGTVSMPVDWDRLEEIYPTDFTLRTVPDLLEDRGDPWAEILSTKQDLAVMLEERTA